jgi:peptide-methionine (R)-S-oxide reductase
MEKDWKKILDAETFYVTREKGTERPFTGKFNDHFEEGVYKCVCCDAVLFESQSKFDSSCGWPSFDSQINKEAVSTVLDKSHGMIRTEITCSNCDSHLGHVFNDGPTETGTRYCVNSLSLTFKPSKD